MEGVRKMLILPKARKYFREHEMFNAIVHFIGGIGVGILITYPFVGTHPVRWGVVLLAIAVIGHLYPLVRR